MELEDLEDLINLAVSTEESLLLSQFSEDASNGPNIDSQTVLLLAEQNFGCPVPKSLNLMGEGLDGQTEGTGKSKVSNLEVSLTIDEKVLRFEVSVDDASGVAVVDAVDELEEEELDLVRGHGVLVLTQIFLHVVLHDFKDQVKLLLAGDVNHLFESD